MSGPARRFLSLLVILSCLLAFLPGIDGPFLHDDYPNLPQVRVGAFSWEAAFDVATRNDSGPLKRPLSNLSLAANYWAGAREAMPYKATNLAIHGLCALALFFLADSVLRLLAPTLPQRERSLSALAAAALWAVHPLQVSTVLYVVQRMAQLPTLFLFLGIACVARWLARLAAGEVPGTGAMLAGYLGFALLAVASKENGALAPLFAGILLVLAMPRIRAAHNGHLPASFRGFIICLVLLPVLAGIALAATHPHVILDGYAGRGFTLVQRLLTEATLLFYYLRMFFLPWLPWMGLYHDDYPVFGTQDWQGWAAVATWVMLVAIAWRMRKRWPLFAFAVAWYLAGHAMESSVIALELAYEHRNYLSLAGPCIALGHGIGIALRRRPRQTRLALLIPFLLLFGTTMQRSRQWSDIDKFSASEYAHHPHSFRAMLGMASRASANGDRAETARLRSEIQHRRPELIWPLMLDIYGQCDAPDHPVPWGEIAHRIETRPGMDLAGKLFRQITGSYVTGDCPKLDAARFMQLLELAHRKSGERGDIATAEALAIYRAWVARASGRPDEAVAWLQRSATDNPAGVEGLFDLAYDYLNVGRLPQAAAAIAELRRRERAHGLHIDYRIDEVEGSLAQAQATTSPQ